MLARIILVVLMVVVAAMPLKAQVYQEWIRYNNGAANAYDHLEDLAIDDSGNVYVTGGNDYNYLTIKYDNSGNLIWSAIASGAGAHALALDDDGNVYVTGHGYRTCKYNTFGNQVWEALYSGEIAYELALDDGGNVYVTGFSVDDYFDYATVKYDNNGNQLWVACYSGPGNPSDDRAQAVAVDDSGNVCVTGASGIYSNNEEITTVKYDSNGNQLWAARYPFSGTAWDEGTSIAFDDSGNVYVAGRWDVNFATIKYDPAGTQLWAAIEEGLGALALALGADGNVYVTGEGGHTYKYDAAGNLLWQALYEPEYYNKAYSIALDDSGNAYVAGRLYPYLGNCNSIVVKYDSDGNQIWTAVHDGPVNGYDEAKSIAVDDSGNVYAGATCTVGMYYVWPNWYSDPAYTTIKYNQTSPPPIDVTLAPINPPINIPLGGGNFDFNITLTNNASSAQNFDFWIMLQLPPGAWHGPVLGPIALTLPAGGSIERLRTQNIPGRAPAGTYVYRAYIGDYPAKWDSSSFPFEKLATGNSGPGTNDWDNIGQTFDENDDNGEPFITHQSSLIPSLTPNPFNPTTALSYELRDASFVNLTVFDITGREVAVLVDGWRAAGAHEVTFDGSGLAAGMYFVRLTAGEYMGVEKMVLLK